MASTCLVVAVMPNCCLDGRTMRKFRYQNHDIKNGEAMMWECDEKVRFHSRSGTVTDWHGNFREESDGTIIIKFDYAGRALRKTTMLSRVGDMQWRGYDYMQRRISLTLSEVLDYCDTCQCWHMRD